MAKLSKEQIEAIVAHGLADPVWWLREFLDEWFPDDIPWVHRGIIAIMTQRCAFLEKYGELDKIIRHFVWSPNPFDPEPIEYPIFEMTESGLQMSVAPNTATMMPRGFAKTTICNGVNLWKMVHRLKEFLLYISESGTHATTQLGSIKLQLEANEKLRAVYGDLVGNKWTADEIETSTGIWVVARGRGGQVRGLNKNGKRPDDITIDDLEDEESVRTPEQRIKARGFLYRAVFPARRRRGATLNMLGTLLHSEAVLMTVAKDPRFNFIRFAAVDRDGDPLWKEFTLEKLEQEKQAAILAGELAGFYMEYMSKLSDASTAKFKVICHEEPKMEEIISIAMAVDPAISEKPGADFFAIAVLGMSKGGTIWVLDFFAKKGVLPREQVDKIFEYWVRWKPSFTGIESIAYQKALVHLTREEMFRKHIYFEITEIAGHEQSKDTRIMGIIQPRYANGYIKHRTVFPELESQLLDYPNGKKDGPDVVAMAVTLLDPYAAAAVGNKDLAEDYYDEDDDVKLTYAP